MLPDQRISRRRLLTSVGILGAATVVVACAQSAPPATPTSTAKSAASSAKPTAAAAASTTSSATTTTAPTPVPTPSVKLSSLKQIPRNLTFASVGVGGEAPNEFTGDVAMQNPFLPAITRSGFQIVMEPPYFYNPYHTTTVCGPKGIECANGEIPWIATSYQYNSDFSAVTLNIRKGVEWSDGQPFTAQDVVFTVNMLKAHAPTLTWSASMKKWVKDVVAPDNYTVKFTLNSPDPRFLFKHFQFHEDIGVQIVPEHIWKNQNPLTFTNFDLAKGWPVVTGAYRLVYSDSQQKIWDRRNNWWAAKIGLHPLPAPERLIFYPGYSETTMLEMFLSNKVDASLNFTVGDIESVMRGNPKVTSWTGNKPPYGYVDWWTTGLGFNDSKPPFDDPEIRWAINYVIDRAQLVKIGYLGAGDYAALPYPSGFPVLQPYIKGVSTLYNQTYKVNDYNPKKSAQIMESKGYKKNQAGFWAKNGQVLPLVIITFPVEADITPVLVQQLRNGGFDASFKMPADFGTLIFDGQADGFVFGHGGSVRSPYSTMGLYQGKAAPYFWSNSKFDKIVGEMAVTADNDPKLETLFHQALAIWLPNMPDIALAQFYHRNPVNTTYWTGWPDAQNPYINSANWHRTFLLALMSLKATQA